MLRAAQIGWLHAMHAPPHPSVLLSFLIDCQLTADMPPSHPLPLTRFTCRSTNNLAPHGLRWAAAQSRKPGCLCAAACCSSVATAAPAAQLRTKRRQQYKHLPTKLVDCLRTWLVRRLQYLQPCGAAASPLACFLCFEVDLPTECRVICRR